MEIKTKEQAEELGLYVYQYLSGDWRYKDTDGCYHLIRDGKEIASGLGIEEIKPGVYKIKSVVILDTTNQR